MKWKGKHLILTSDTFPGVSSAVPVCHGQCSPGAAGETDPLQHEGDLSGLQETAVAALMMPLQDMLLQHTPNLVVSFSH